MTVTLEKLREVTVCRDVRGRPGPERLGAIFRTPIDSFCVIPGPKAVCAGPACCTGHAWDLALIQRSKMRGVRR